ncbi:MAG: hydroxymethylglutaryl-CoA lyase [Candidatus Eremiobacteraeota bacterium]|nr:hydroxymethylglutaryl-CoA lyase [Candidatus Eremiobacteraeota bacterium]MBC5827349.1 hydroxymethylglutaryl-CoA lyase [Candidatus Eremiobacteraeota bacterium]
MALPFQDIPKRVRVVEVGPRDGLQNESRKIPTEAKVRFVDALSLAGLPVIEVTSFVSARAIPQLADAEDVLRAIRRVAGVRYCALVPNERGLESALAAGVSEVAVFTAASETFNRHNINATVAESIARFVPVVRRARAEGIRVRGYVSTSFGCPYEGSVAPQRVLDVVDRLMEVGVDEVSIGDTIGIATPNLVVDVCAALLARIPVERLAMHFHDTRGTALANVMAALEMGIAIFDSSAGGLGGCPYAPGASGNLATEDLLYLLDGMKIETGVSLAAVVAATSSLAVILDHEPTSRYYQAHQRSAGSASQE